MKGFYIAVVALVFIALWELGRESMAFGYGFAAVVAEIADRNRR